MPTARRTITSHDVARQAGVSQSTVSRALRGDPRVSATTRARVRAAAAGLGYIPSEIGRSLVTRRTRTIAIVVTDLTSAFYPYLVAPLHAAATDAGYRLLLFTERIESGDSNSDSASSAVLLERLADGSVDGVVLTTSHLDGTLATELAARRLPLVFLTRYVEGVEADCAIADNARGASMAAIAAVRAGHTRIGAIFGPANATTGRDREVAIRVTLEQSGAPLDEDVVRRGSFVFEDGYAATADLLSVPAPPTVILCANDIVAFGAYNAVVAKGLRVPNDVSLVGFDDLPMAAWDVFGLTTVQVPMGRMAETAVGLVIERIEGRAPREARKIVFEPRLVMRRTLGAPSSAEELARG